MNQELESKKYIVLRNFVSEEVLKISQAYYTIKFFIQKDFISRIGSVVYEEKDIVQPFSIWSYADAYTESLLLVYLDKMREITGLPELEPTYSFVRLYENGQWLGKHTDRPSCQYSLTLPLVVPDNSSWDIFLDGNPIDLKVGDMVLYKGCEAEHWREPFEGRYQIQAHLHYVDGGEEAYEKYINDGRESLGSMKGLKHQC